ncbi:hypothetical protein CDCA_CDCA10G2996 [Cyanidium caldarium]|uniref:Uncharacterized protein n=1 Tax=Cyanidium caldarium TaxID=2771 RepID=A0AAV9IXW9_CYACA|nr:hypothetical protein CDCA_CDCA10G2996 [Cyanidium caldarium]
MPATAFVLVSPGVWTGESRAGWSLPTSRGANRTGAPSALRPARRLRYAWCAARASSDRNKRGRGAARQKDEAGRTDVGGFSTEEIDKRAQELLEEYGVHRERKHEPIDSWMARRQRRGRKGTRRSDAAAATTTTTTASGNTGLAARVYSALLWLCGGRDDVLVGAERGLSLLVTVFLTVFLLAGGGITFEALAVSTKHPLPDAVDAFVRQQVEPTFTPSLVAFLFGSSLLGVLRTVLMQGSPDTSYREDHGR